MKIIETKTGFITFMLAKSSAKTALILACGQSAGGLESFCCGQEAQLDFLTKAASAFRQQQAKNSAAIGTIKKALKNFL